MNEKRLVKPKENVIQIDKLILKLIVNILHFYGYVIWERKKTPLGKQLHNFPVINVN